jgi:Protein of unknown function (DUF3176)
LLSKFYLQGFGILTKFVILAPSYTDTKNDSQAESYALDDYQLKESSQNGQTGKEWKTGFCARFPVLGCCCLLIILASIGGVIAVLLVSDSKNIDTWDSKTVKIAKKDRTWKFSVSTWIAMLNFIMGQAFGVLFGDAVAVSWWLDSMKGQTIRNLHYRWEVGQSPFKMILRRRFWGLICIASVGFTAFAGLETLLQQASSPVTALNTRTTTMSATLANALPAGFSGVIASWGHDSFSTLYYAPPFVEVLQNYSAQSPIHIDLDGCPSTSNSWCAITLPGVGFQYTCTASRSGVTFEANGVGPKNNVFQVDFALGAGSIILTTSWKDTPGTVGMVIANRTCTLVPAIVEYPANVSQNIVTLESPTSTVIWTSNSTSLVNNSLSADKVLQLLPYMDYDKSQDTETFPIVGSHSTLGGISLALSRLFSSEITAQFDPTNLGARIAVSGSFVTPYAQFAKGTDNGEIMDNTFLSPMDQLLNNIRDIMFRSTLAIAQQNISDYVIDTQNGTGYHETNSTHVPAQSITRSANYFVYETVYKTNKLILGLAIGLMLLAIMAVLPLYWGFWRLGRDVSLSPLEVAKALHYCTTRDPENEQLKAYSILDLKGRLGSNHADKELVELLGRTRVKYGEVDANILGMGLTTFTIAARNGCKYV